MIKDHNMDISKGGACDLLPSLRQKLDTFSQPQSHLQMQEHLKTQ